MKRLDTQLKMLVNFLRIFLNMSLMIVLPYYIFTIDYEATEDAVTQVKDFTALIILIDLDNILAPTAGVDFEKLGIFNHKSLCAPSVS